MQGDNDFLKQNIRQVKGVGGVTAELLGKLGVHTIEDMLFFFPRQIEDRSEVKPIAQLRDGESASVTATVASPVREIRVRKNLTLYSMEVRDGMDIATLTWFNNRYVKNTFQPGDLYHFYGKVSRKFGKIELSNPTYENASQSLHTGRVVPVYPLTERLAQKTVRTIAKRCVDLTAGCLQEYLPASIRESYSLCEINFALSSIHFPASLEDYQTARRRLAFEELLFLQAGLFRLRSKHRKNNAVQLNTEGCFLSFSQKLSFSFTPAQLRVLKEIYHDLAQPVPMSRLIQGDVGSGKTAVAFAAMDCAYRSGKQSALMAPTEVLASQHYASAMQFFPAEEIALLTGSTPAAARRQLLEGIQDGTIKIIIGTHALLEEQVQFQTLSLVITDEQHRFGVNQRAALAQKGISPHMLVMSATPIPRTLALILYGDLDISIIDQLPPGRKPVDTFAVEESMRPRIHRFLEKEISAGRQAFIVCPLAEESEKMDLQSAAQLYKHLQKDVFPLLKIALLYGKMKSSEKNRIMTEFAEGSIDILVSTTVIEVGINVPNASVMVIENAERFGLSALHQLRGRVGRGAEKSYCILISGSNSVTAKERLSIMTQTNDGFKIANKDLELRGPGDFLGVRQHGLPDLKIANLITDQEILREAGQCAKELFQRDPALSGAEYAGMRRRINELFSSGLKEGSIS